MRRLAIVAAGAALTAALSAGCATETANTNTNANTTNNGNTGVLTNTNNNNTAATINTNNNANANTNARRDYNANVSEADYERDKDRYGREAREAGDTVGSGVKDGWLWVKAKGTLAGVDDLRDSTINVDVDNAAVTLRGTVASQAHKAAAEKAVKALDGVKSVRNQLAIRASDSMVGGNDNRGNANNANRK
ncbi:MAG: BON domain-containing protein [Pyrinomonadaceae bacterium]